MNHHLPECIDGPDVPDEFLYAPCDCAALRACEARVRDEGFRDGFQSARSETARQLGLLFAKAADQGWSFIPEGAVINAAMGKKW